jgi:hypothetical protein
MLEQSKGPGDGNASRGMRARKLYTSEVALTSRLKYVYVFFFFFHPQDICPLSRALLKVLRVRILFAMCFCR